jgi:hypothetical protein
MCYRLPLCAKQNKKIFGKSQVFQMISLLYNSEIYKEEIKKS